MLLFVAVFLLLTLTLSLFFLQSKSKSRETFTDSNRLNVVYINLDHRTDRRTEIENELQEMGLPYERFPAIKDKKGAIGCCKSHLAVLKRARDYGYPNLLVLEDDFHFVVDNYTFDTQIKKLFQIPFDVCLLAYNTEDLYETPYPFLSKIINAQTTSGYLVQSHYYDTLISHWEYGLKMFQETGKEHLYTFDQSWKKLQERDTWYCFTERIGIQRESFSDIQQGVVNPGV